MTQEGLTRRARGLFQDLCVAIATRPVGRQSNRDATALFAERLASFGFETHCPQFECIDWAHSGAVLTVGEEAFEAHPSPYSLGCDVQAPLVLASTADELEAATIVDRVLLLHGEIARGQLMPKNFPWYNPDEHKRIIALLERGCPLAIIAATSRDPEMVGSQYPFPLIEDGDFDIPSVFVTDEEGERLAGHVGRAVALRSQAQRLPSTGCNVVGRRAGSMDRWIVLTAHIDTRDGTPGALDNTSGVVVLLLLAELLRDHYGKLGVEIVALNGEDYYDNPGEKLYLRSNQERMVNIGLNINLDDVGYSEGRTAYSLYGCPEPVASMIHTIFAADRDFVEGPSWPQGDHMIFVQSGRPALAITSELFMEVLAQYTHTERDRPELVDYDKLAGVALALAALIPALDRNRFL